MPTLSLFSLNLLSCKLLWRNFKSGELRLLTLSLILAVAVVSGISLFTDRLKNTLTPLSTLSTNDFL